MASRGMLVIPVTADVGQSIAQLHRAEAELKQLSGTAAREGGKTGGAISRLGDLGGHIKHKLLGPLESIAPALGAAGLVEFGREAFQTAMEGQMAEARLAAAVKATGESYRGNAEDIEAAISRMRDYGFAGDQTKAALARLITTTHSTSKATSEMSLVANIARARHIGLEDAATLVGKVMTGNTAVLKRMGIDLGITNGGLAQQKKAQDGVTKAQEAVTAAEKKAAAQHGQSQSANDALARARERLTQAEQKLKDTHDASGRALDALNKIMGGQAAAASETAAGKIEVMKAKFHDLKEAIGNKLISGFMILTKHIGEIAPPVLALVGALVAYKAVSAVVAVGNAIMGTSFAVAEAPIAPIIAGLVALGLAGYELYKHWSTVWGALKGAALATWHFLRDDVLHPIEHALGEFVAINITEFRMIADVFLNFVGLMLHGAAAAFGWIPGIGGKLKHARDAFDSWHKGVDDTLTGIANKARGFGANVANNFASGILTGKNAVANAAAALAVETQHRLRTASPAKLGPLSTMGGPEGWGQRIAAGFARGIVARAPDAGDAAGHMASQVARALGMGVTMPLQLRAGVAARASAAGGSSAPATTTIVRQLALEARAAAVRAPGGAASHTTIININVEPGVYNARELAVDIRDELVKLVKRGGSTGLKL